MAAAKDAGDSLATYRSKRDFSKTAEPQGEAGTGTGNLFVVQKHDATRLHYDFRLELDGVLKSWAVTRGPSLNPADKRLAVRTEDHPLSYGRFEGTIPKGEYGGGTVMVWDLGRWEPTEDPHEGLKAGRLKFQLFGKRLKGLWALIKMKPRQGEKGENWLLIKDDDAEADRKVDVTEAHTTSVESGRDLEAIAKGHKPRKGSARTRRAPLPDFRPPQLATLVDAVPAGSEWLFELKYDGYRALAAISGDEVAIYTRSGKDWTDKFGTLKAPLGRITTGTALIDGEIVAFDDKGRTDFSTLKDALSTGKPLAFFAFDLLEVDGQDLTGEPLSGRKARLKTLLGEVEPGAPVQFSDHIEGQGQKVYEAVCAGGHEGIIAKDANAPYRHERTRSWLKVKCANRQEFIIAGWRPSAKRKRFASLLLGTWEDGKLVYRGRVGTGFKEAEATTLQERLDQLAQKESPFETVPRPIARAAHWVRPELVAEIAFTEFTPDGVLRHPSFIGLREDKPARDIGRERAAAASTATAKAVRAPSTERLDAATGVAQAKSEGVRLTSPDRVVYPGQGLTKGEIVAYYAAVHGRMLTYLADRPLSLVRCPQGRAKHCFFQKHDSGGFPPELKRLPIIEKDGAEASYFCVDSLAGLIAGVQMNVLEWHVWGARRDAIEKPERLIFDIDPDEGLGFAAVKAAALDIRAALEELDLESFPMVTGGKGIHVIVPLRRVAEWPEAKAFAKGFAQMLAAREPDRFTAVLSKAARKGRLFVDYLRNERGSTAIAPFSTRSREGAPVAVPIGWDEVEGLTAANQFGLAEAAARAAAPDPWGGYDAVRQSISKAVRTAVVP